MAKPSEVPSFATDALLTSGPQTGSASRLRPSNAMLGQGFYQDRRLPARMLSWVLGMLADWTAYLYGGQVKNWKIDQSDFFTASTDLPIGSLPNSPGALWVPEVGDAKGFWFVYGASATAVSSQAFRFPRIGTTGAFVPPCSQLGNFVCNTDGSIMLGIGKDNGTSIVEVYQSTTRASSSWLAVNVGGTPHNGSANPVLGFSPVSNLFLGVDGSSPHHGITSTNGLAWTDRGALPGLGASEHVIGYRNGGTTDILITTIGRVLLSSDGGLTWAATTLTGTSPNICLDAVYSATWGWLVNINGALYVVNSTWTLLTAIGFSASKVKGMASDGAGRFVWTNYDTTGSPGPGIYFSDDGGVTKNFVRFSALAETNYLPWRVVFSGEQWGVLGFPTTATNKYAWWISHKL